MADAREIEVSEKDLPLHCPAADAPLWSRHPRVFLDVTNTGHVLCPYCGTQFVFRGVAPQGH
ncbi:MAG: zinc-finger domain-containing protein [Betaproteobacteria bacterium]|nr:zinc-finger domain-containing protein [Betaproteobacteria bacterium]